MSVTFDRAYPKTLSELYGILLDCKTSFTRDKFPRVLNIAFDVLDFDALAILNNFPQHQKQHFYFAKDDTVFLGLGKAIQIDVESHDRFAQTQEWIKEVSDQMLRFGGGRWSSTDRRSSKFFCGFSFFEQTYTDQPKASILLPRWQLERVDGRVSAIAHLVLHGDFLPAQEADRLWEERNLLTLTQWDRQVLPNQFHSTDKLDRYTEIVERGLGVIRSGQVDKIVLAHGLDVVAERAFTVAGTLANLHDRYPSCYCFSTACGQGDVFLGASPERLVSVNDGIMLTEALAGSAPRGMTEQEDLIYATQLLSSDKESHEHQLVSDFIAQKLTQLGIEPIYQTPRLLQLPNIQHRHTPISGKVPKSVHLLDILASLHPTPAVAGFPRELSCQYIRALEDFDRGPYAAPIGWVDGAGNGEFAVGIRSALIRGDRARLFAGAGIVAGSDPDRERREVQMKLQALLEALV
jgi:menaquinone-specific isochorismate synthase